jgi:TolB protein
MRSLSWQVPLFAVWAPLSALAALGQTTEPADYESQWFRNVRQLTSKEMGLDRAGEGYFSPDMKRISFQAFPRGQRYYQIYVMNLDGTGLQMVSTGQGATTCSFFHPSGQKLIFASNHEDQRPPEEDVATTSQPGSAAASQPARPRARHDYAWHYFPGMEIYEYTFATGQLKRLTFSDGYDAECAYSPDGRLIVFSSLRDKQQHIYICDADGGNPRRVTSGTGQFGGPFFSPDGRRIVYRADRRGDGTMQVVVNDLEGRAEQPLTDHDTFNWSPYWHPSGKWVIFVHVDFRADRNFDLYVVRDDGSESYRVTSDPAFDGLPVFSPDGRYLMWTSKRNGLDSPQLFIAEFIGLSPRGDLLAPAPQALKRPDRQDR